MSPTTARNESTQARSAFEMMVDLGAPSKNTKRSTSLSSLGSGSLALLSRQTSSADSFATADLPKHIQFWFGYGSSEGTYKKPSYLTCSKRCSSASSYPTLSLSDNKKLPYVLNPKSGLSRQSSAPEYSSTNIYNQYLLGSSDTDDQEEGPKILPAKNSSSVERSSGFLDQILYPSCFNGNSHHDALKRSTSNSNAANNPANADSTSLDFLTWLGGGSIDFLDSPAVSPLNSRTAGKFSPPVMSSHVLEPQWPQPRDDTIAEVVVAPENCKDKDGEADAPASKRTCKRNIQVKEEVTSAFHEKEKEGSKVAPPSRKRKLSMDQAEGSVELPPMKVFIKGKPSALDIILGRGAHNVHHSGNQTFLRVRNVLKPRYEAATTKPEKFAISLELVGIVEAYGGRFVQPEEEGESFFIVDSKRAREKCSQALRDPTTLEEFAEKRARYSQTNKKKRNKKKKKQNKGKNDEED